MRKKGILLITTLLIIALLTGMTVGFVMINRDNLQLAVNVDSQEAALQAAYAGIQYATLRFEKDGGYGPDLSGGFIAWSSLDPSLSPEFTACEGKQTVVGILNGGASHFQIHFGANQYDDSTIADYPTCAGSASWSSSSETPTESINNLASGGSITTSTPTTPPYSALIISIGYSNGVTREVETLLERTAYVNSSVNTGNGNILVNVNTPCPVGSTTCDGNGNWYITSNDPLFNNITAGNAPGGSQPGGNIQTNLSSSKIYFSNSTGTGCQGLSCGSAYALINGSIPTDYSKGIVSFNGTNYGSNTNNNQVAVPPVNNGAFNDKQPSSPSGQGGQQPLNASNILQQVVTSENNGDTVGTDSNGNAIPSGSNTAYIPAGTWAFEDAGGKGDVVDVYDSSGNLITQFKGNVKDSSGNTVFTINNFQLQISPGKNLVVDDTYPAGGCTSNCNSLGTPTSQVAAGNMMVTLDPNTFTNSTYNYSPDYNPTHCGQGGGTGGNVLPGVAFSYSGCSSVGSAPSTLTVGGNMFVEGSNVGLGAIVAEKQTASPSNWIPSSGSFSSSWASWVVSVSAGGTQNAVPPSGESGDVYVEGSSQLSSNPTASVAMYADNNAQFNPIPTYTANSSPDGQAYNNATYNFAVGAPANGTNQDTGGWSSNINCSGNPNCVGPHIDQLDNYLNYDDSTQAKSDYGDLLRYASAGHGTGLDNAQVGATPTSSVLSGYVTPYNGTTCLLSPGCVTDANVAAFLGTATEPTNINLYQYAGIEMYHSGSSQVTGPWLATHGSPGGSNLNYIEQSMTNNLEGYANNANNNNSNFGSYMAYTFGSVAGNTSQGQDMSFSGMVYVAGSSGCSAGSGEGATNTGFYANTGGYKFSLSGALVSPNCGVEVDNAGQVNFNYDPSQVENYVPNAYGGYKTKVLWMTVW